MLGFASAVDLTPKRPPAGAPPPRLWTWPGSASPLSTERIELADEPAYGEVTWISDYQADPFAVSVADKIGLLADWDVNAAGQRWS